MRKIIALLSGVLFLSTGFSQISTTVSANAQQLAEQLAGPNVTVTNATLTGSGQASGSFTGTSNLDVDSGVILCTGNTGDADGANNSASIGADLGTAGTAQMDALAGVATEDAITLQFDFEVQSEFIQFDYIFASEEYPEFAPPNNSGYNDVFAFYISGAGITGEENIALVPGTSNAVAINNINPVTNNQYYVDNDAGTTVQFDGFTTLLTAKKEGLTPCTVYTLKLVIADAGDGLYSSAVFLKENSLIQGVVDVQTQTVNADNIALEGCIQASFTFSLDNPAVEDTPINFEIGGTATNGIDYSTIDNSLTIPQGQSEATIYIDAIQDGFVEGQESIFIIFQAQPCSEPDTAFLYIDDAQPIEFSTDGTDLNCNGNMTGVIDFDASGGFPPYTYYVTTDSGNGTTSTHNTEPITDLAAGIYSVQVYDIYGCKAEALVIGGSFDAGQTFLPDGSGDVYESELDISGFSTGATLDDIDQLQQICMNMEHSYMGDLQLRVISPSGQSVILKNYPGGGSCDLGEPIATAPVDGQASSTLTDPGVGYDYCFNATPDYGTMVAESNNYNRDYTDAQGHNYQDNYLPAGSYLSANPLDGLIGSDLNGTWTIEVIDNLNLDNGYIFNWNIAFGAGLPDTLIELEEPTDVDIDGFITQANCGGSDGEINISVTGDYAPYTFLWSNGETTEDVTGLSAGAYEVFVTDVNLCTDSAEFILNNISSINTTSTITQVMCSGGTNGAIDLSISGGTSPYNVSWSNSETSEDISNLSAGDYTVTITDDNGCTYSETITVTEIPSMNITANTSNEQCGTWNGAVDISVSGGSGSYGYSWSNSSTTEDLTNLQAGTYTVTVTDGNSCTAQQSFSIINDVSNCSAFCYLTIADNVTEDQCGQGIGTIDITINDATNPYSYTWSNGALTEDLTSLVAGDYTITVTDANQCVETATITVGNNTGNLTVSNNTIVDEICGNGQGSIDLTISGGALPYSFYWSNGGTNEDQSSISEGDYTVTVTDGTGCTLTQSFTVANNTGNLSVNGTVINEVCSNSNGGVDLTVNGANGNLTYLWTNSSTLENLTGVPYGTYSCTITDQSGCTITTPNYIINNSSGDLVIANQTITNESCGNANGGIDLDITGTGSPFSFDWSNAATSEDITGLTAGNYSCNVTDINGCETNTGTINLFNDASDLAVSTVFITDEICGNQQGAVNIDVTGGNGVYAYSWSNSSTSQDLSNISAGDYTLTVTDGNGCSTTHNVTVNNTSGTLSHVTSIITNEICGNGSGEIDLQISGGSNPITYTWSNAATSQDLTSLSAGTYSVLVSDNNGCELNVDATVTNEVGDLAFSQIVTSEVCSNGAGSIDLSVTGGQPGYTFLWSNAETTEDLTTLSAGTYSCIITDANSCSIETGDIIISNNPGALFVGESHIDETCGQANGSIDLLVNGQFPFNYSWSNTSTTEDLTNISAGDYTYTVTDGNGCVQSATVSIINNPGTLVVTPTITDENCDDDNGSIDLEVTGGANPITFAWSNTANTEDINTLNSGNYNCLITDNNGCSIQTGNLVVSNNVGDLSLDNVQTTDEQCGNGLGAINISVSGGLAPYTFAWSNTAITEDLTGLSSGTYTCVITDDNGCTMNAIATVGNNSGSLSINNVLATNESCGNGAGSINTTVQGGSLPYTFLWSNNATTEDITNLTAGSYTLTATDDNGCSTTHTEVITNAGGNFAISNVSITEEICGNNAGAINITLQNGIAPYSFVWSNGATTEDVTGLVAGTYDITVTDDNGCSLNESYVVNANNGTLSIDNVLVNDEQCGDATGTIDVTVSGGSLPLEYAWSSSEVTEDLSNLSAGDYDLTITDNYGCTATTSQTIINQTAGFTATINSVTDENCADGAGEIDIDVSGGTNPYTFVWSNAATSEDLTNLSAGDYSVTVTDNSGCSVVLSATVNNITTGLALASATVQPDNCGSGQGFIDLSLTGGTQPYTFLWSNTATTEDISGLTAGDYTCLISDNSGCSINQTWTITDASGGTTITSVVTDEVCGQGNGTIEVTANGGVAPYLFGWNGQTPTTCCDYTLNMFDTGNSWNGGSITVIVDGTNLGDFTVPGGGANVETFEACTGESIELIWNSGNFDNEVFFNLTDPDGNILYNHAAGLGPNPGTIYSANSNCSNSSDNSSELNDLSEGTYSVTITDAVGCELTQSFDVENNSPVIQFVISNQQDDECNQSIGSFDYQVSGGTAPYNTTYNGQPDFFGGSFSNLSEGTFALQTTDDNGCVYSEDVTVNNITPFTVSEVIIDENCGSSDGAIDLTLTGTFNPTYSWSNGPVTEDLSNLSSGDYTFTIADQGCIETHTYTINNLTTFTASGSVTDEACSDGLGSIDVTVNGSGTYTFNWSNAEDTEDITGLSAGTYTVEITEDGSGCSSTLTFDVENDANGMTLALNPVNDFCGQSQGSVISSVNGGSGNITYLWSDNSTSQDLTNVIEGQYSLTITDVDNNCSLTETIVLGNDAFFDATLGSVTNEFCSNGQGSIDINVTGGNPTFLWSNAATTEDLSGLSAGTYTLTLTEGFCTDEIVVVVENEAGFTMNSMVIDENCGDGQGAINLTVSGGLGTISYNWSSGETTEDLTGLSAGDYSVTIIDDGNNCLITEDFTVVNNATFSVSGITQDASCSTCNDGSIDITINGTPTGNLTFVWSNGASTEDISNLLPGEYTLTATDDAGCSSSQTFTILDVTGIDENNASWDVDIYPNPSQGLFNIDYSGVNESITIDVLNSVGQVIRSVVQTGADTYSLNLHQYETGVYFVRLSTTKASKTYRILLKK